jgi:hypothetical protein
VTKAEIDVVVNANPAASTLIKQSADGKFKLFYLPATKELSFITTENGTGKQYSHVWKSLCRLGCRAINRYEQRPNLSGRFVLGKRFAFIRG